MKCALLGWGFSEGGAAVLLASKGYTLPSQGGVVPIGAPQGTGLHVWEGDCEGWAGAWRRATLVDLDEFQVPLSVRVAAAGTWCCKMREKFLVTLGGVNQSVPMPTEFADFVLEWGNKSEEKPTVWGIKFCPFCGVRLETRAPLRVHG